MKIEKKIKKIIGSSQNKLDKYKNFERLSKYVEDKEKNGILIKKQYRNASIHDAERYTYKELLQNK